MYKVLSSDKQFFLQNGFLKLSDFIDQAEVDALKKIYDKLFEGKSESGEKLFFDLGGQGKKIDDNLNKKPNLLQILMPRKYAPELIELNCYKKAKAIAEQMFDQEVSLREHMIYKPANYGGETPWHQDQSYHSHSYIYKNINFWIPLQDTPIESGCLHFVPQSHLGSHVLPHHWNEKNPESNATEVDNPKRFHKRSVACPLNAGGVTLHHSYMLHYAKANTSIIDRRALIIVAETKPIELKNSQPFPWVVEKRNLGFETN